VIANAARDAVRAPLDGHDFLFEIIMLFINLDQSLRRCDAKVSSSGGTLEMTKYAQFHDAEGIAALGICQSLLLALTNLEVIGERDMRDLLVDVVTTHDEAAANSQTPEKHRAVVEIVQRMLAGRNGMRR
jgi:hypothetical protein